MIAIPLPFVVAMLLAILAAVLFIQREENTKQAFLFVALCAVTTTIVGLRWTFDLPIFRLLQPVLAACIPATAWYCFAKAHKQQGFPKWHFLPPILVLLASLTYPFWRPPLDPALTLLYVAYGAALIRISLSADHLPEKVRLSDMEKALKAERIAGAMLLMSAAIDGALAIDFALFSGQHTLIILAIGHAVLLPVLAAAVVMLGLSVAPVETLEGPSEPIEEKLSGKEKEAVIEEADLKVKEASKETGLSENDALQIMAAVDTLFKEKEAFLDPDLTLDRLARKVCIPARQISAAINQVHGRNVSQVVNEYRIERAKELLVSSDKNITQIYMDSGFQTKSNFHREFSRVTGQTPSAFRRSASAE
ncbi:AraC family transcriptional regulator [Marinomonas sp. C2222]|uniref:AraC family transcriptional regulator n=1 Tax=Marinomonas sargassi TaxID=2984494 RepID=A0ABT2YUN8_9GAMM|nr:AraC family transcriptional regulator [Marinomonas sargassi]MCV2403598.1 AraC family transcriptional regulator [Marinomonas sargassi]